MRRTNRASSRPCSCLAADLRHASRNVFLFAALSAPHDYRDRSAFRGAEYPFPHAQECLGRHAVSDAPGDSHIRALSLQLLFAGGTAFLRKMFSPGESHVIIVIAVIFAISVATTEWVMKNAYEWRYWTVPVVLIFLVLASFVADSMYLLLQQATASSVAASAIAVLLFAAAIVRIFGLPSVEQARASIDAVSRVHYAKIEQLGCTHMIGDYWIAWSSVFYNRSHDIQPPLWAVSLRSEPTEHLWSTIPPAERRYCGVCGDRMNNYYEIVFKLSPLRHTGQADNLCVFQK